MDRLANSSSSFSPHNVGAASTTPSAAATAATPSTIVAPYGRTGSDGGRSPTPSSLKEDLQKFVQRLVRSEAKHRRLCVQREPEPQPELRGDENNCFTMFYPEDDVPTRSTDDHHGLYNEDLSKTVFPGAQSDTEEMIYFCNLFDGPIKGEGKTGMLRFAISGRFVVNRRATRRSVAQGMALTRLMGKVLLWRNHNLDKPEDKKKTLDHLTESITNDMFLLNHLRFSLQMRDPQQTRRARWNKIPANGWCGYFTGFVAEQRRKLKGDPSALQNLQEQSQRLTPSSEGFLLFLEKLKSVLSCHCFDDEINYQQIAVQTAISSISEYQEKLPHGLWLDTRLISEFWFPVHHFAKKFIAYRGDVQGIGQGWVQFQSTSVPFNDEDKNWNDRREALFPPCLGDMVNMIASTVTTVIDESHFYFLPWLTAEQLEAEARSALEALCRNILKIIDDFEGRAESAFAEFSRAAGKTTEDYEKELDRRGGHMRMEYPAEIENLCKAKIPRGGIQRTPLHALQLLRFSYSHVLQENERLKKESDDVLQENERLKKALADARLTRQPRRSAPTSVGSGSRSALSNELR